MNKHDKISKFCHSCKKIFVNTQINMLVQSKEGNWDCRKHSVRIRSLHGSFLNSCPKCSWVLEHSTKSRQQQSIAKMSAYYNEPVVKRRQRLAKNRNISINKFIGHQAMPGFNPEGCKVIDGYGKYQRYGFQYAMKLGKFYKRGWGNRVKRYDLKKPLLSSTTSPITKNIPLFGDSLALIN